MPYMSKKDALGRLNMTEEEREGQRKEQEKRAAEEEAGRVCYEVMLRALSMGKGLKIAKEEGERAYENAYNRCVSCQNCK